MAQWLRQLSAHAEEPASIPNNFMAAHSSMTLHPGDLMPSSALHRHQGIMQAITHTHNSKNK